MKKYIFILFCICLSLTTFASSPETHQFEYEDLGVTIIFEDTSNLTNDERQYLADKIVYGDANSNDVSTYAWC